jgi:dienelactone hydrolase
MWHTRALLLIALAAIAPTTSFSQVGIARMEVLSFQSLTMTDQAFLTGSKQGKPVTIAGELRLPRPGTDRLPAIILVHGSGGISGYVTDWEQEFNAMGVATFVIDSWSGRGITSVVFDQSQLGRLTQLFDLYRALEILEKHPRIDPSRIAVMGFSRGGQAALYSSVKRFQRLHGPLSGREFAAYVALYPTCLLYREDEDISAKPIRIFHGGADDYVPVGWCRAYAQRLKAKGFDIQHTEFPGAYHVFDWQALRNPTRIEKGQTSRHCELKEGDDGRIMNVKSGQPFTYSDPCVEYGVTTQFDEKASTDTRKAVKELVLTTLKP